MNRFNPSFPIEEITHLNDEALFLGNLPFPVGSSNTIFTAYGRNALFLGLRSIKKQVSKFNILVPAYSCGDEIATIRNAGFTTSAYAIKDNLQIDLKSIVKQISSKTVAILITHFFGFPQEEVQTLADYCKKSDLFLIEDCAHSLGSSYKNKALGTFGDISIFSLRKFYPIPHGGALVINNNLIKPPRVNQISDNAVNYDLATFFSYRAGILIPGTTNDTADLHGPRLKNFGGYNLSISNTSKWMISKSKLKIEERRYTYNFYYNYFTKKGNEKIKPLIDNPITNNVNPLFFPLLVADSEFLCKRLRSDGDIVVQPFWSYLHKFVDWSTFPKMKRIKKGVIVLPVSQTLLKEELDKILKYE